jgi:transcriptional regulator with XRE-family HTH domain
MGTDWRSMLRVARRRRKLGQRAVADLAGISVEAVRSYENARRSPSREHLFAILDALKLDRTERNPLLAAAGYASDGYELSPWPASRFMFTPEEAAAFIEDLPWPAFVCNETMELTAANAAAQRLWSVDLNTEFLEPLERNLLGVASNPRFAERCTNLAEVLNMMAAVFKGHHRGAESMEDPSAYFAAILERFFAGDPNRIQPFLHAWQTAVPRTPKIRWEYPVVWDDPDAGTLRFRGIANPASEPDGLAFNDWIPLDAATWTALEHLKAHPAR